jgi:hypothetical protein
LGEKNIIPPKVNERGLAKIPAGYDKASSTVSPFYQIQVFLSIRGRGIF